MLRRLVTHGGTFSTGEIRSILTKTPSTRSYDQLSVATRRSLSTSAERGGGPGSNDEHTDAKQSSSSTNSAKTISYSYDGYSNSALERRYGPDKELLPKSRKPPPFKVVMRNETGPYEAKGWALPHYPKRKHPRKRTTGLLSALASEEALRMIRDGRAKLAAKMGRPKAGQIVRIGYVQSADGGGEEGGGEMKWFSGVIMVVRHKLLGASIIVRNVVQGVAIERAFPLFSPLVKQVDVIGQRRVVRNKLYFLREKPLKESTYGNALENPNYVKKKK